MSKPLGVTLGALAVLAACTGGAAAAPQVLALIASNDIVPLTCERGRCAAELTAICLQPDRASPPPGRTYTLTGGEGVTVLAETRDGRSLTLAAEGLIEVRALRGHNAVSLGVAGRRLHALGLKRVAIRIGEGVSLVPTPVAGDKWPLTPGEIDLATGPMRSLASRIVDHGGTDADAARLTRVMVNALPRLGRADPEARAAVWRRALDATAVRASEAAMDRARRAHDACQAASTTGVLTLRGCLGAKHDSMIGGLNNAYWDALDAGS